MLPDSYKCQGYLQMAACTLGKQTAGCNSSHDWLMTLAVDLTACVICGDENDTNGCHLAGFSEDVVFYCHSWLLAPPTLALCRNATGIGYASKTI